MARSRVSLSPALNLVLGLAIKSLLTDIQMVCVSGKSQGAREMSPRAWSVSSPPSLSFPTSNPSNALSPWPSEQIPLSRAHQIAPLHGESINVIKKACGSPGKLCFFKIVSKQVGSGILK